MFLYLYREQYNHLKSSILNGYKNYDSNFLEHLKKSLIQVRLQNNFERIIMWT